MKTTIGNNTFSGSAKALTALMTAIGAANTEVLYRHLATLDLGINSTVSPRYRAELMDKRREVVAQLHLIEQQGRW